MWHEVKPRLALEPRATNIDHLKEQINAARNAIPLTFSNDLILDMETRRLAVIDSRGFQTRY